MVAFLIVSIWKPLFERIILIRWVWRTALKAINGWHKLNPMKSYQLNWEGALFDNDANEYIISIEWIDIPSCEIFSWTPNHYLHHEFRMNTCSLNNKKIHPIRCQNKTVHTRSIPHFKRLVIMPNQLLSTHGYVFFTLKDYSWNDLLLLIFDFNVSLFRFRWK